jgi:GTPase SAR1 family protein
MARPPPSPRDDAAHDHVLKLLLVGDPGVGKSSILVRYADGTFDARQNSTVGG